MNPLALFDALLSGPSWGAWRAFVAAVYGLPLSADELEVYQKHSNRKAPRPGGYPEAVAVVGVQSGKSRVSSVLAVHAALTGEPGTTAVLVAQDTRGALRALGRYARQPFEGIPAFAAEVERQTADLVELRRGTSIAVYPCRPAALRGIRANVVVLDELGFYITSEGRPTDAEMLRVARGRVATTSGKVIVISSPYTSAGTLFDLYQRHHGVEDSPVLIWQSDAQSMNPLLTHDYLERMREEDPEGALAEVDGQFRTGVAALFDYEAVAACVEAGVRERPPVAPSWLRGQRIERPHYCAFVDAASGSGKDSFACAVAHPDGERVVLDCVRAWKPAFNPSGVIGECSDVVKRYGLREVTGDRFAAGFVLEGFRMNGITYRASDRDRSTLYLDLLPMINAGSVVLLDVPELLRELRGLERRRGTSGRDKVDHRPGSHDDQANACAGALTLAATMKTRAIRLRTVAWG
jgi:hypothetical protein